MSDIDNKDEQEIYVNLLTNEPSELKLKTMELIYGSIAMGQLAYMDGKDSETGEVVPMLVGLEPISDTQFKVWPIARLFMNMAKMPTYLVPDGAGSYYADKLDGITVDDPIASLGLYPDEEESGATKGLHEETTLH